VHQLSLQPMKLLDNIDTIIFDFGGVIIDVDYDLTEKAFQKLGIKNFDELYSQAQQSMLFDQFETGQISPQEFREKLKDMCKLHFDDHAIDHAWNAMLGGIPDERLSVIERLRNNYRTFVLSNTNVIHIKFIENYMDQTGIKNRFYNCFEKVYFSFEMKQRKPHPETFETVIEENNLIPSRTLFVDDSIQHIKGAEKAGLNTLFLEKGTDITDVFLIKR
jgi:glucose-1-phosphatase